jgi:predicted nucleic acid-binding protein
MKVLIDTCVVIDVLQNRMPFSDDAQKIFLSVANRQVDGCLAANSITDIYYITRRYTHNSELSKEILNKLFSLFNILDTSGMDCRKAVSSAISDYEDAVMVETAVRCEVDCIVTRNLKDYSKSGLAVYSPSEFLEKFIYE